MFEIGDILKDSGAVVSSGYGTVDASPKVVNLKDGLVRGNLIVDISAIKISDGDELYEIHLMGGSDESFTKEVSLCSKELGANAAMQGNRDSKPGRFIVPFQSEMAGTAYPFVRVRHYIQGTSPSINYQARMEKDLPIRGFSSATETTTTT